MTAKKWALEDFEEGGTIELGAKTVTAEEIIEFAREFDAQPMHLDEEAGKASILGGLAASGWHTCCMFMRMMCDGFLLDSTSQGSPGLDYVRWKKPVLAGDTLTGRSTVIAKRGSKSKPGLGFVTVQSALINQRGDVVMELQNTGMFLARETVR
ncbi:MaoC family dehydratase [Mesorhizobium sp. L-8-3]|uniref:MaoC family dehydratase n=1 Tax=Mesorhizobium sp. L-8-3 TaxID=2744522 RepID=UPI0019251FCE|nr:MaoC family dehydratase [Mesorhizobium sp. L-8-3]BCH23714.1 enoyl-CoA hydratase [Mesorhizobium sp. L-8-3]